MASVVNKNSKCEEVNFEASNFFWVKNLDEVKIFEKNWIIGTTTDENKVKNIIDEYCHSLPCDFVRSHPSNLKQKQERNCIKSRILWQLNDIPYHGIPFSVASHDLLKCTFSMDYNSKKRRKVAICDEKKGSDSNESEDNSLSNNFCPAKIIVKKLISYPSFALPLTATKQNKLDTLKALKKLEAEPEKSIETENVFWLRIPLHSYHNHSFRGKDRTIHRDILTLIKKLVKSGNISPESIKDIVNNHVKEKYKNHENPPLLDDQAYYPSIQNIHYVIYNANCRNLGTSNESDIAVETNNEETPAVTDGTINDVETYSKSLGVKPNTLEDVVQAFCLDSFSELDAIDSQSIMTFREKISKEISRVLEFVNKCEEPERLEYILNVLSNLPY